MAAFHQHVTVSTALGAGYAAAAHFACGIDVPTCVIAGGLTGLAGMLPDLDTPTGKPVREVFGLASALMPVLFMRQLGDWYAAAYQSIAGTPAELTPQLLVVLIAASYFFVRFAGAWLLDHLTVHRGMFHSIPAALIVALLAFLLLAMPDLKFRLFLAGGPFIGFLSHLVMDEMWSVKIRVGDMGLKKSTGTAFKLFSGSVTATCVTYLVLLGLCYALLMDPAVHAWVRGETPPDVTRLAEDLIDSVRR